MGSNWHRRLLQKTVIPKPQLRSSLGALSIMLLSRMTHEIQDILLVYRSTLCTDTCAG